MRVVAAPRSRLMNVIKLGGLALAIVILVFVVTVNVINRLNEESAVLNGSPELIVELLDEQGLAYLAPTTFAYQAVCGQEFRYQSPSNLTVRHGHGTIPIRCPSGLVTELRISFQPADPSCSVDAPVRQGMVSGLTLRHHVTCTR